MHIKKINELFKNNNTSMVFQVNDIRKFDLKNGDICIGKNNKPFIYLDGKYVKKNIGYITNYFWHVIKEDVPYFFSPARDFSMWDSCATYNQRNIVYYQISHYKITSVIRDQELTDNYKIKFPMLLDIIERVLAKNNIDW